ncbi:non-ribosomal peptide synthetase, partial [uncultured Xanthomonas sp.]|uniref:non-ribosomal peptide synthetase n=1 Tax=uncultured Xanthomonas sp. TaxID=152831 RepID=UPI0025DBE160
MDAATLEFPLTLAQSDIYFDQQRYPDDPIYNIGGYIRMGAMDAQVLRQAHARLVEGDDAFGLRIRATREGIVQYVASVRTTRLEEKDFSDALDPAAAALAWLDDRFREAFVLYEQELYRAWILRLSAEETWYCVIAHHLIIDGWGFANLARKLGCHCRGDVTERPPGLHSVAADDVGYVDSPRYQDDARHWKSRVATAPEPLLQAYHRPRYRSGTAIPSGRETVSMPASEYAAVQALAERYRVGVPQVLLGVFALCAGAQGDRDRFLIGLPVHNRRGQVQKQAIGVYTGMMPLAVELAPHMAFGELVRALSERQRADYRHQRYPVGHLCRDLGISGSDATVFDVSFNYLKLDSRFEIGGHAASIHYLSHGFSQTPLALTVWEYGQTQPVEFHFDYNLAYLEPAESQRFAARFQHALSRLLQAPELRMGDLSALPPQEAQVASGLACGPRKEVAEVLVHRVFEAHARNQPDAIAVVDEQGSLSYAELNRQANRLAHRLIARGAAPDRPVAVCTERRRELLVGILAVLKAGSAYLPIDPVQPDARIAAMLSDAEPLLVLVSASTEGRLAGLVGMEAVLVLEEAMQTPSASDAAADTDPRILGLEAGHLAYIIYTSGSSGTPKGVMLTHAGLANLALTLQDTYALDANDRVLQFSSIGFDAATWDWARTLVAGATLYLCPETVRGSGEQLSDYLQQHAISHALIPPAALAHVDASRHYRLRSLIVGGEACDPTLASTWAAKCRLFNAYGPTEATVAVSQALLGPSDQVSIGSPLPNTELRIVDRHGGVAPIGAAGELWISGVGLARGYVGQPDATAQRFVVGQGVLAGRRWYRTGDRARWRADGQLEFLGRLDDQLKVRGFRIEPGEIEAALHAMPEVLSAAVGAAGEGMQRRVIAYVCVVAPPTGVDARHALFAELRRRLQRRLPDYMVPAQWVLMQRMPLNANGKIDRRALPSPDQEGSADAQPQTDAERQVLRIWCALLGADQVGIDTDFFAAGGHSLLASRLAAELSAYFARDVTLRFVFEHRSIRAQAQHVAPLAETQRAMVRAQARDLLPLSLLQQRLWLDDRVEGANAQYNIPVGLRLRGALHLPALQAALQAVVDRHDVLRSSIRERHGHVVQHAVPVLLPTLPVIDAGGPGQADLIFAHWRAEAAVPFDLAEPLKLRASLLEVAPDDHVLLLTLHHIAADGGSMRTLVADLNAAYRDAVRGCPTALPALPLQYADYAAWERQDVAVAERTQSLAFWREALQRAPSLHRLPLDRPRPLRYAGLGAHFHTLIDAATVQRLEAFAARCETTLFMALHALLALTIGRWSDEQDVLVATPVDCREHPATESMIGLFVNTLPLRTDLSGMPTFEQLLNRCRIATFAALAHRNLPFDDVVQAAAPERTPGAMPLCQILFSLDNAPLPAFALPDLDVTAIEDERQPLPLNFDLDIAAERRDDALRVRWHYRPELFDAATVARFAESFHQLLAAALAQPQAPVHGLEMLADSERGALRELEGQGVHVAGAAPVFVRVEDVARAHPTAVAIVDDARTVCYQELERESNRLAHWLRSAGAGQGKRIGLYLPRSWRLPWAVLATLKTGAAYVPLDPGLPAARLQQIVQASALHAVVTLDHLRDQPALAGTHVMVVDDTAGLAALAAQDAEAPAVHVRADDPAYLIFTSGSTGFPKGVKVGHGALSAYLAGLQQVYAIAHEDRLLQFSAFNFDVFVEECLMALCHGACLVIRDDASAESADAFWRFVDLHALSVLNLPTAFWHLLADTLTEDAVAIASRHVRLCVVGGEAVRPASILRWCEAMPATLRLLNGYGPTEATVTATVAELSASAAIVPVAPIGRPLPHVRCLVLDGNGQRVPRGVSGELYLGGAALALGYAGDDVLTAQRFVSLAAEPGRWYRTGDRVRWAQDGQLQFLGRADEQVKIRGYRIELGEVRARLDALAWVRESVVLAVEHPAGTRLAAYLVAADVHLAPVAVVERVRDALAQQLPHYMIPMIVPMARFPLTANGKIDLRALPPALVSEVASPVAPQTAIERTLLALWERLLGLDRVGVEEDFFALGGHSLLAARLAAEASRALGHPVPARAVFEHPSVRRLAAHLERSSSAAAVLPAIARAAVDDDAPLSPAQERLWFLAQLEPASRAYHMHAALQLQGTLDVAALRSAFVAVVARHSVLRSRFPEKDGRPRQVTDAEADSAFEWHVHDGATAHQRTEAERVLERSFDLQHGPLLRIALLREDHGTHLLHIAVHHIVFDGWSMRVLMDELGALYAAHRDGRDASLPALALRYVDYAVWERDWLSSPEATFQERAWAERLDGAPLLSTFPADRPRPAQAGGTAGTLPVAFDAAQTQALQAFSRRHGVTLFTTVLASWAAVLARMSGQQEIVLGTATANRDADAVAGMIGLFVNSLPLRLDMRRDLDVAGWLAQVRAQLLDAQQRQRLPLERVVEVAAPVRSLAHSPLFQVFVAWQDGDVADLELAGVRATALPVAAAGDAKFDVSLVVGESADGLSGLIEYAEALYERQTVEGWLTAWRCLLDAMLRDDHAAVQTLPLMQQAQRQRLLQDWAGRPRAYADALRLEQRFAQQVARAPDAIAVVDGELRWTYAQLDAHAATLAQRLQGQGLRAGGRVALALPRSAWLLAAQLATLRCGGAYVPLDLDAPPRRRAFMLEDSAACLLLRSTDQDMPVQGVAIDVLLGAAAPVPTWASSAAGLDAVAYVMYTSGSSGQPKGVAITHRGIRRLVVEGDYTEFGPGDCIAFAANPAFDASTMEVWAALLNGGRVAIADRDTVLEPARFGAFLQREAVTVLWLSVGLFNQYADAIGQALGALRCLLIGGDVLDAAIVARFLQRHRPAQLLNGYGPTETTTFAATYAIPSVVPGQSIPIGRPIRNTRLYVLDAAQQPVPVGAIGELYIGGDGVAAGYVNLPDLTAERFLPDPFAADSGRMYRSGDLARWRADGMLEFVGRRDGQVKLRGFRIELAGVQSCLAAHPSVRASVVIASGGAEDKRLLAYWVAADDAAASPAELRAHMAEHLPDYMIPAAFVQLDALPLTANGKIDRRRLPEPQAADGLAEPASATERLVAGIWQQALRRSSIDVEQDFFALGGHSLLAMRLAGHIGQALGRRVPVRALFEHPSVRRLAQHLDTAVEEPMQPIAAEPGRVCAPLSFAQRRIWFADQLEGGSTQYNVPCALHLRGGLDLAALQATLDALVARHAVLRTVYAVEHCEPVQRVLPPSPVPLARLDLAAIARSELDMHVAQLLRDEASAAFDLSADIMLRGALVDLAAEEHLLLLTLHHIASDGESMGVVVREFGALYRAFRSGAADPLPPLPVQYADYAVWQQNWLGTDAAAGLRAHWRERLQGAPPVHALPLDRPRPLQQDFVAEAVECWLPSPLLQACKAFAAAHDATVFMVLQAALAALLSRWSGERDIVVGTPVSGRTLQEVEPLIGFFVNTVALRTELSAGNGFAELLAQVRERALAAFAHQDLPFDLVVDDLRPERTLAYNPVCQIKFVLQTQETGDLSLPGLDVEQIELGVDSIRFDFDVTAIEVEGRLRMYWSFQTALFDGVTVQRMAQAYVCLLQAALASPALPFERLPLQGNAATRALLALGRGPVSTQHRERSLVAQVQAQAAATPEAVAVRCGTQWLDYAGLERASNRLAHALQEQGIGPDARVGVALERSVALLVALLGTLKAGAAYVPLDLQQGPARLRQILDDAQVQLVLLDSASAFPLAGADTLFMDEAHSADWLSAYPSTAPALAEDAQRSAYVLYTSGSTGTPKGVEIAHGS